MLIIFQTDAYESITLFGHIAQRLLAMMGESGTVPGALLAGDVPHARALLQQAINAQTPQSKSDFNAIDPDAEPEISLAHRALPLLELLKAAEQQKKDVLWRVG